MGAFGVIGAGALNRYLSARAKQAYAPGVADCALFQADCHAALTGVDLAERWRGKYRTFREGLALMRADGYADPRAYVESFAQKIEAPFVRFGDLAFKRGAGGFVTGPVVYFLTSHGLGCDEISRNIDFFRVI
jgi:glycine/D-amino acid oxidase-like deaminating enzyme